MKKYFIILLLAFAPLTAFFASSPLTAFAAISADTHAGTSLAAGTQRTLSYTPASGATFMLVCIEMEGTTDQATSTSVNFNGIVGSKLTTVNKVHASGGQTLDAYGILNPTSGAHTLTVSYSASVTSIVMANTYLGSNSSSVPSNVVSSSSLTQILGVPITVGASTSWVVGCGSNNIDQVSITSGGTIRENTGNIARASFDSNTTVAAGSFTTNWSQPTADANEMFVGISAELTIPAAATVVQQVSNWIIHWWRPI